jgi:amidase
VLSAYIRGQLLLVVFVGGMATIALLIIGVPFALVLGLIAGIFEVLRAQSYAFGRAKDFEAHRDLLKDTVVWNIEQGMKLSGLEVSRAQAQRAALFQRVREFFERYDFLLVPVSQVVPFPIEVEWVREINGIEMENYIDWMKSCSLITLTEHPAMSVPCGFTPDGLPVGVQIVGRFRREIEVLQLAHAFEQATRWGDQRPAVALQGPGADHMQDFR